MIYTPARSRPPLQFELIPPDASPSGLPRLRFRPAPALHYQSYADAAPTPPAPNPRLHEILSRMGEICLSRELAGVMIPQEDGALVDPARCLRAMLDATVCSPAAGAFLASFAAASLPPPALRTPQQPITLCAWRLDGPGRVCLFTGEHPRKGPALGATFAPHTLSKVLLEERSKRPDPSRIHLLSPDTLATPDAVRTSLLHHAQTALTPYRVRLHHPHAACLDHTLEEAFATLIHPPTRNHTEIPLNQSPPWDKDHIDSRCARETS